MSYIGHRNPALKRIGISKWRLMLGGSTCAVCDKRLPRGSGKKHKCIDHVDWELIVVDGPHDETIRQHNIARLLDTPDWPEHA